MIEIAAVESPLRTRRPERDLLVGRARAEEEVGDGKKEGDLQQRRDDHQRRVELKDHTTADDRQDDREGAKRRMLLLGASDASSAQAQYGLVFH